MLRIGGTASPGHITVFRGLKTHFQQQGIALDWVLYSDYDALVEAFATREIDLAWTNTSSTATGFKIWRSTDGITFTQIATLVGATPTTYRATASRRAIFRLATIQRSRWRTA